MFFFKKKVKEIEIQKISAEEYFSKYLSWRMDYMSSSNLNPKTAVYESFSSMADNMLTIEVQSNVPGAIQEQGERYYYGLGMAVDVDKAIECFEKAAELGHPEANYKLAEIYKSDEYGRKDMNKYFDFLSKSARRGYWLAMFNLSCAYYKGKEEYNGYGFKKDKQKSLEWQLATFKMITELLRCIFSKSCSQSFKEYTRNMCSVFNNSVVLIAEQLISGDGVEVDKKTARNILEEAISLIKELFNATNQELENLQEKCD